MTQQGVPTIPVKDSGPAGCRLGPVCGRSDRTPGNRQHRSDPSKRPGWVLECCRHQGPAIIEGGYGHCERSVERMLRIPASTGGRVHCLCPLPPFASTAGLLGHGRTVYDKFKWNCHSRFFLASCCPWRDLVLVCPDFLRLATAEECPSSRVNRECEEPKSAQTNLQPRSSSTDTTARLKRIRAYAMALTSQVTVCGKAITMTSASPCRAMNGRAPLWMSMTFTSLGATVWR